MFKRLWRKFVRLLFVGGAAAALLGAGPAYAADSDDIRALKQQLEAQKQQMEQQRQLLEDLQKKLGQLPQPVLNEKGDPAAGLPAVTTAAPAAAGADRASVESIVADYLKRQDEAKKSKEEAAKALEEAEGHKVGSDLKLNTFWNPANGPTFATKNKDFVSHIGVRFQMDSVWWDQNKNITGNIGDLQDGVFFRRVRPSWDGQAWEVIEWNVELALEQIQNDVINLDQVWVGLMNLPAVGTVRVGHLKTAQGLEGDTTGSSKSMSFLERSSYTDAFYQNFSTGVMILNNVANQRVTYALEAYRQDNAEAGLQQFNNGADFGDGNYGYSGRITALPIWENDGRCFLHLGVSYSFRESERAFGTGSPRVEGELGGPRLVEFRARPQMRDAIGDYGGTAGNNATPAGLPGDSVRIVDTGAVAANTNQVIGTEAFYVRGPLSFMAEYAWAAMDDASAVVTAPAGSAGVNPTRLFNSKGVKNGTPLGTPWFDGGYVQVGYFLTGENRTYDRRIGTVGGTYIASPYTPFWLTRGEDGRMTMGRGAWELVARWNYLDLNSGNIAGGKTNALELGVNWFLTTNLKLQFEYLWQDRYHLAPGQVPGDINGFGI
ncbi:MAG TPA: porin, partial [Gemmataceae bacterium]|nr:porin [Gemmataceae bacterium]